MKPELEDIENPLSGFFLEFCKRVNVSGIQYQRLFADGIGTNSECKPDMGIMQVVR